jgi:hypothetical protein
MGTQLRRLWLNLALLLLVAGLGGFAWWKTNQPEAMPDTLTALQRADITHIAMTRYQEDGKPETIRLERQGESWHMLEPRQLPVNPLRIRQLLTLLDETVDAYYDAAGKDLKQYGLEPGKASLQLNTETFVFGTDNPISHKRYILHGGKIQLVSEAAFGLLTGDVLDLAANTLVPVGATVKSVVLPAMYNAKAAGIVQNWQVADALRVEVLDKALASKGKVTLTMADGTAINLDLLSTEGDLVLGNAALGIQYVLPDVQRKNLFPAP